MRAYASEMDVRKSFRATGQSVRQIKAASGFAAAGPETVERNRGAASFRSSPRVFEQKALSESVQRSPAVVAQRARAASLAGRDRTGLPDALKSGVEALSGVALDGLQVHYNSARPAQLNALAYAQNGEIFLGPGQEHHLPHEAWHVAQQAQGRVSPTTQVDGVPVNDDTGLEREADQMGARAAQALPVNTARIASLPQHRAASPMPVQRVLVTDDGELQFPKEEAFRDFVKKEIPSTNDTKRFWDTPIMVEYLKLVNKSETETVALNVLKAHVLEARVDAERLDTLDPDGPVPEHHELVRFAEEGDESLHDHSIGPVGYAGKMMGKEDGSDDFRPLLNGVSEVLLTTGTIEDVREKKNLNWELAPINKAEGGGDRRPGLSIINYSEAIYQADGLLAICGVRGKILMDQFGLAIREYTQAKGQSVRIETIFNEKAVSGNYQRLCEFFKENPTFQWAHTVVFGYASAFEKSGLIKEAKSHGWVGYLFKAESSGFFAVFDSDLKHSYHGEILAKNVQLLLKDPAGSNVTQVLIGGSAGSLVDPRADNGQAEEQLTPNGIYIPEGILRPDGYFKRNSLHNIESIEGEPTLETLPGSMHTSVVSVLAETPGVLNDLFKYGIKTVDMEFAYVALVLGEQEKPTDDRRDLANVKLGVACLVTDFPRTGAHGVVLAEKDTSAKQQTKNLFVRHVIAAMK